MKSPAHDIAKQLDTQNYGKLGSPQLTGAESNNWRIFVNHEPQERTEAKSWRMIVLYDTVGSDGIYSSDAEGARATRPGCQIRVTALESENPFEKLQAILNYLETNSFTGDSTAVYQDIRRNHDPFFLQKDEQSRSVFIVTVRMIRQPPTS